MPHAKALYSQTSIVENEELAKLIVQNSYRVAHPGKPFILASGDESNYYFECQRTTLNSRAMPLIARAFLDKIDELGLRPDAVGGLITGADPIITAILYESYHQGREIVGLRVRKEPKNHGAMSWIEGPATSGMRVVVVDDVLTRGTSVIQAIRTCRDQGFEVVGCIVLVDREQNGGMERIAEELGRVPVSAIFSWSQLRPLIEEEHGTAPL